MHPTIFAVVFLALTVGNAVSWRNAAMGAVLAAAFVGVFGTWVGRGVFGHGREAAWAGAWVLISGVMVTGAIAYYAASYTLPVALFQAMFAAPIAWWLSTRTPHPPKTENQKLKTLTPRSVWAAATIAVAGLSAYAWVLATAATDESTRSAWERVPAAGFVAFGAAVLMIAALAFRGRERALTVALLVPTVFLFLASAIVLFPLGYGFDPFIHQATEEHIAAYGSISPKPLYYVGQYVLVLFAHHAFALPIALVNALLVPVLAAFALPLAWYGAAARLARDPRAAAATLPLILLLPLAPFTLTTPQGLASLWTLLLILAAVPVLTEQGRARVWPLAIPAAAALLTHPIAGIPAALFVALLLLDPSRPGRGAWSRAAFWALAAIGCVSVPASFVANALMTTGGPGLTLENLARLPFLASASLFLENRFDPLLDFVYLYGLNATALFVVVALAGWGVSRARLHGALRVPLVLAVMLAANWALLSSAIDFSFLIDYERQNFASRLVPLALFFLSPFVLVAYAAWTERTRGGPVSLRAATVALVAALSVTSLYLAYPRHDAYVTGHGYNVSRTDLAAVRAIDADANGSSYVALANQTVSAAAVHELGFVRYFGDQFYYPIPTGGALYEFFLTMNDRPSRATAAAALALANASCDAAPSCAESAATTLYYVVNEYWWEAPRIVETAKQDADAWWALDGGAIHVFRYDHPTP